MTIYLSNRDGDGKTSEEGHYRFPSSVFTGNVVNGGLLVTQNSPLGLSAIVTAGDYKIDTGTGYSYHGWLSANEIVAFTTADGANPRIDAVVLYVDKGETTSASPPNNPGITKLKVVAGTPGGVPSAPNSGTIQTAVGASNPWIRLANVTIGTSATQVTNANISDQRILISLATNLVSSSAIQDNSITLAKMADNSVGTSELVNSSVTTGKIGNNQVTAAKIEAQMAWITPSMSNGWVNYDSTYNTCQYMKDSLGFVWIKGLVKSGTSGLIFTLPAGYRPIKRNLFATATNSNVFGRADVDPSGQVIATTYSNTWFSLDTIRFRAEL